MDCKIRAVSVENYKLYTVCLLDIFEKIDNEIVCNNVRAFVHKLYLPYLKDTFKRKELFDVKLEHKDLGFVQAICLESMSITRFVKNSNIKITISVT